MTEQDMIIQDLRRENAKLKASVPQWISERYLAVKKRIAPDYLGGNRTDIIILRFFVDKGFRMPTHIPDWINEEINEEVTHWMPIPQPPKEVEE